jgi:DNA-binding transcriptional MocR family regulator
VRAGRPAAHHLCQRLRQDPGAQLARRLPGGAARTGGAPAGHQAAGHADHACPAGESAGLCIEQGQLRRHAERIRTRLDAARSRSVKLALHAGCTFAAEPAGLFGWVDTGVDTDELAQRMLDEGYLLAPARCSMPSASPAR